MARQNVTNMHLPNNFTNELCSQENDIFIFRSSISSIEDINTWVAEFGRKSNTKWISRTSSTNCKRIVCSKKFLCQHSKFNKAKGNGTKLSKNTECLASLSVKIKLNSAKTRQSDPFIKRGLPGVITLNAVHNHPLDTAQALRFLPPDDDVKHKFMAYFDSGLGIAESCRHHEEVLKLLKEFNEESLASGMTNPTYRSVRWLYDQWRMSNLGPRTGDGLIEKLEEKQEIYKKDGVVVEFNPDPFAIAVVTPLMQRAHQLPMAKDIVFADSTSACDPENHTITFLLTPSQAGAMPLGILISKGQTEESYTEAFTLLKKAVKNPFCGNGYPSVFLTDMATAEINALKSVWPESDNLFCIFHVLQAIWRYLWEAKHNILKEDRPKLMTGFKKILFSLTISESFLNFQDEMNLGQKYENFRSYLIGYWINREKWCLAWRSTVTRGHHTNNFLEVCVRLFKDNVLSRVKAYNAIAIVDFISTVLEDYYCNRLRQFANGRTSSSRLLLTSLMRKATYLNKNQIEKNERGTEYFVPSETDLSTKYCVNMEIGSCSCPEGIFGKFCKHQCGVFKFFDCVSQNFPPVTACSRYCAAKLALGDKTPPASFYASFHGEATTETSNDGVDKTVVVAAENTVNFEKEKDSNMNHGAETHNVSPNLQKEDVAIENRLNLEEQKIDFSDCLEQLSYLSNKFGSSSTGCGKLMKRLNKITSEGQWETFLHTACCTIPLRRRDGVAIRVQPTSLARRSAKVTRGSKRMASGRPPKVENRKPKRKRNLSLNVKLNQPNAKSHGNAH